MAVTLGPNNVYTMQSGDMVEAVVREKMQEWNPNVSDAEVMAATEKVLATGDRTYADGRSIGVGEQFDLSAALPPGQQMQATGAPNAAPFSNGNGARQQAQQLAFPNANTTNMTTNQLLQSMFPQLFQPQPVRPVNAGGNRLDQIAGSPVPGSFGEVFGLANSGFGDVVNGIGGVSILNQRGLFFSLDELA